MKSLLPESSTPLAPSHSFRFKAAVVPGLITGVVSLSFAAIFFRKAAPTHPLIMAGVRLLIAAVVLTPFTVNAWRNGRLTRPVWSSALVAGVLYGVHFGTWVTSLTMTSVAASVTLVTTNPIFLGIFALFTGKDKPGARLWISIAIAFIGLLIIGGSDLAASMENLTGDLLALAGAIAMSLYLLLGRRLGHNLDVLAYAGIATATGGIMLILGAVMCGIPLVIASWESFGYIALAALIPQLIGHNLLTWALRYTSPTAVSMTIVGEPVGATVLGWLWLGESVSLWVGIGCAVTLGAVMYAIMSTRQTGNVLP